MLEDRIRRTGLRFIKRKVTTKLLCVFPEFSGQCLSACERILELLLALICLAFLRLERLRVDVLTALSDLATDLICV